MDEAKWTSMTSVQKRRAIECLNEPDRNVRLGYLVLTQERINALSNSHELYHGSNLDTHADVTCLGVGYAHVLETLTETPSRVRFTFDQFYSPSQSKAIKRVLDDEVELFDSKYGSSHSVRGVQSADCVAGAVSEKYRGGTDWEREFDSSRAIDCTESFCEALDRWLSGL